MSKQETLSDYERMKPTFEHHKAIILKILHSNPSAHGLLGLTDDKVSEEVATFLRNERIEQNKPLVGRKKPTVDNRLRDLATQNRIVRIKGYDGLKHNFHPDIFAKLPIERLRDLFSEEQLELGLKQAKEASE